MVNSNYFLDAFQGKLLPTNINHALFTLQRRQNIESLKNKHVKMCCITIGSRKGDNKLFFFFLNTFGLCWDFGYTHDYRMWV
jgi:hypothetical protein